MSLVRRVARIGVGCAMVARTARAVVRTARVGLQPGDGGREADHLLSTQDIGQGRRSDVTGLHPPGHDAGGNLAVRSDGGAAVPAAATQLSQVARGVLALPASKVPQGVRAGLGHAQDIQVSLCFAYPLLFPDRNESSTDRDAEFESTGDVGPRLAVALPAGDRIVLSLVVGVVRGGEPDAGSEGQEPRTVIQVVPSRVHHRPGLSGAFTVLSLPKPGNGALYSDGFLQGRTSADPEDVAAGRRAYDLLVSVALSHDDTADLIGDYLRGGKS